MRPEQHVKISGHRPPKIGWESLFATFDSHYTNLYRKLFIISYPFIKISNNNNNSFLVIQVSASTCNFLYIFSFKHNIHSAIFLLLLLPLPGRQANHLTASFPTASMEGVEELSANILRMFSSASWNPEILEIKEISKNDTPQKKYITYIYIYIFHIHIYIYIYMCVLTYKNVFMYIYIYIMWYYIQMYT